MKASIGGLDTEKATLRYENGVDVSGTIRVKEGDPHPLHFQRADSYEVLPIQLRGLKSILLHDRSEDIQVAADAAAREMDAAYVSAAIHKFEVLQALLATRYAKHDGHQYTLMHGDVCIDESSVPPKVIWVSDQEGLESIDVTNLGSNEAARQICTKGRVNDRPT